MCLTEIQKEIIRLVLEFCESPNCTLKPCIEQLQANFKYEYSLSEIEANILKLISKGIFEPYSYQSHLRFTEGFKGRDDYQQFKENIGDLQKSYSYNRFNGLKNRNTQKF